MTASSVILRERGFRSTTTADITPGAITSFTLKLPTDCAFTTLTGATEILVYQQASTNVEDSQTITAGTTLRVHGLPFKVGDQWVLVKWVLQYRAHDKGSDSQGIADWHLRYLHGRPRHPAGNDCRRNEAKHDGRTHAKDHARRQGFCVLKSAADPAATRKGDSHLTPDSYARWRSSFLGAVTEQIEQEAIFAAASELKGRHVLDAGWGDGVF